MNRRKAVREIYLAGGCFWGLERYMENVAGVIETEVGYANGNTLNTSYEDVKAGSGHAETVRVMYDSEISSLPFILRRYFDVIDPQAVNVQGGDVGPQYRTGVYYTDPADRLAVEDALARLAEECGGSVAIEALPLSNYCTAEEYHQQYLHKNPGGYCHISWDEIEEVKLYSDEGDTYGME